MPWLPTEGTGEVQTPGTAHLRVGDRVWFRHGKAGELCEHGDALHGISGDAVTDVMTAYRGEGRSFG